MSCLNICYSGLPPDISLYTESDGLCLDAQVGRETEVDCALAELYVRTLSTEHLVKDTAHSDIFNSIYTRMNEVSHCT